MYDEEIQIDICLNTLWCKSCSMFRLRTINSQITNQLKRNSISTVFNSIIGYCSIFFTSSRWKWEHVLFRENFIHSRCCCQWCCYKHRQKNLTFGNLFMAYWKKLVLNCLRWGTRIKRSSRLSMKNNVQLQFFFELFNSLKENFLKI